MPKYRIHFEDGTHVEKSAADGTVAKTNAKRERRRELPANTEESHASLRVVRVEELGGE